MSQKHVGQNRDRQTYSPVAVTTERFFFAWSRFAHISGLAETVRQVWSWSWPYHGYTTLFGRLTSKQIRYPSVTR